MPRNRDGFLKADALKAGIPDQYAIEKDGVRHEVEIRHSTIEGGFFTTHKVIYADRIHTYKWQTGDDLPNARQIFAREVREIGA